MTERDRAALELALSAALKNPTTAHQFTIKLESGESRLSVARFASYSLQIDELELDPHQLPPCSIDPNQIAAILRHGNTINNTFYDAAMLAKMMLKAGVSRFHPYPVAALKEAECTARMMN
jgi:hypothetical protein